MNSTFCSVVAVNNYSILFLHRNLVQVSGDPSERDPPVPIPNTAVKPLSPDGTARASVWESRKLPGLLLKGSTSDRAFCYFRYCFPVFPPFVQIKPHVIFEARLNSFRESGRV